MRGRTRPIAVAHYIAIIKIRKIRASCPLLIQRYATINAETVIDTKQVLLRGGCAGRTRPAGFPRDARTRRTGIIENEVLSYPVRVRNV